MSGPFLKREGEGAKVKGPALGLIESSSIARGFVVTDQMVKKAPVELVLARTVSPGKYLILVTGEVADVGEAMQIGIATADEALVDRLELAQVHDQVLAALSGKYAQPSDAIGVLETFSVASALLSADAACKAAEVSIVTLRLADGIGGKAFYVLDGSQADVDAALLAGEAATPHGLLLSRELIARPHDDLLRELTAR